MIFPTYVHNKRTKNLSNIFSYVRTFGINISKLSRKYIKMILVFVLHTCIFCSNGVKWRKVAEMKMSLLQNTIYRFDKG